MVTAIADRSYPAKILLFGEYSVLLSGAAIAVPYRQYRGNWLSTEHPERPAWVAPWLDYLKSTCGDFLDMDQVIDYTHDRQYHSDIPVGSGLGSSGALTASIYNIGKTTATPALATLKDQLGLMESFFHGKSSGLDPLISYLDTPIYCAPDKHVSTVTDIHLQPLHIYLLYSGVARQGKSYISEYLRQAQMKPIIYQQIADTNNHIIQTITSQNGGLSISDISALSTYQYEHMSPMIVDEVADLWKKGLDSGNYAMKLCGAGGGGHYMICTTEEMTELGGYQLSKLQM